MDHERKHGRLFFFGAVLALLWSGCSLSREDPDALAAQANMTAKTERTQTFEIYTLSRVTDPEKPWTVYIEGDGFAWVSPSQPSLNPTPRKAVGLRLAALDPAPNLLYLARPCQFTKDDPHCSVHDWTDGRFSEKVIRSLNEALTQRVGSSSKGVHLVGYSGGGAVATLLAARRTDVLSLRTVAGTLDSQKAAQLRDATPLSDSLNPADVAASLRKLPQEHFFGMKDDIIPMSVARAFAERMGPSVCLTVTPVPSATHADGWEAFWKDKVQSLPACR